MKHQTQYTQPYFAKRRLTEASLAFLAAGLFIGSGAHALSPAVRGVLVGIVAVWLLIMVTRLMNLNDQEQRQRKKEQEQCATNDNVAKADCDEAPTRLCCGQKHYGPVCPDNKVLCCLCFGRFSIIDLNTTPEGKPEDVCKSCALEEATAATRDNETPP